ncbi:MAG: NAD-dependent epimerase/dehydratase family protein [Hyphomicrobiaceae bacterium]
MTGATGPVGQAVVARLLAEGHDVAIVTRRPFLAQRLYGHTSAIVHEWHPLSEPLPRAAIEDCDRVLNLMGAPLSGGRWRDRETLAVASRVTALRRIRDAFAGRQPRLVSVSMVIAPAGAGEPLHEAMAASGQSMPAGHAVATWEAEAQAAQREGSSVAIARLGLVATSNGILHELARLAKRGVVPNLKSSLIPAIALDDAAELLAGLLDARGIDGIVHGVAPSPVRGEAVMRALRALSPLPRPMIVPPSLLRRRLGLSLGLLGCRRRIVPEVLKQAGADFARPDPTEELIEAMSDLGSAMTSGSPPREATPRSSPGIAVASSEQSAGERLAIRRPP